MESRTVTVRIVHFISDPSLLIDVWIVWMPLFLLSWIFNNEFHWVGWSGVFWLELGTMLWLWWRHTADDRKLTGLGWCRAWELSGEGTEKSLRYNYSQYVRCKEQEFLKYITFKSTFFAKLPIEYIDHWYWSNSDNNCANDEVKRYPPARLLLCVKL